MTEANQGIGGNNPPGMIETAAEIATDLSEWMKDHPTIESLAEAAEAKVFIDRASLGLKDLEDERDGKVRPLNDQVKAINATYSEPRRLVERVLSEIRQRVGGYIAREEAKRRAAAEEARRLAQEAEAKAREAERIEQERLANASVGEVGIDVLESTREADQAFSEYKKAERQAAIAEKETKVKITGGFSRAIGLRVSESFIVTDAAKALAAIGSTPDIDQAIIKAAKAYRKLKGVLPPGVSVDAERTL